MKTGISYTGKQIHPNSNGKNLFKLLKKRTFNEVTKQKMDTRLSKHVQDKNKQNGSIACNQSKGLTWWLGICCCLWDLVTQVAVTTVS